MSGSAPGGWGEALAAAHAAIDELVALIAKQDAEHPGRKQVADVGR